MRLFIFFVVAILFVFSCSSGNELRLSEKNFEDEISRTENLSFKFNHNLMPDSLLSEWDTVPYLQFDPPLLGKFRWQAANHLVFSPSNPLPPNTNFKVTMNPALLGYLPKDAKLSVPSDVVAEFHTPYLEIDNAIAAWAMSSQNEPLVGAWLYFSEEIEVKELANRLKITANGSNVGYELITSGTNKQVHLEIKGLDFSKTIQLDFSVAAGMPIPGTSTNVPKTLTAKVELPSPDEMSVLGVEAEHDGSEGHITVATSQQPLSEGIQNLVSITPKVPFTVTTSASGLSIDSEQFNPAQTYTLQIESELTGIFKSKMGVPYNVQVAFGQLKPLVEFVETNAQYLSNKGNKNIAIRLINIEKVKVKIAKIFSNNIQNFLQHGTNYDGFWDEEADEYQSYNTYDIENHGQVVFEKEYATTKLLRSGQSNLLKLDFQDKLPQFDGIYVVEVRDSERQFLTASKIISFSDIGLIVKKQPDGFLVFANSIIDATSLSGVELSLFSQNNQNILKATTDNEGVARFDDIKAKIGDFKVAMILAEKGSDFNYLHLENTSVNTSRFDVSGRFNNESGYQAFLYGDRDLYRPGETINLSAIVRKNDQSTPGKIPVRIALLQPNGTEYRSIRKTLDAEGATETSIALPANCVTGTYAAEIYSGNDLLLTAKNISVEEFVPDRIKVDLQTDAESFDLSRPLSLAITATNLFGPPAANRKVETSLTLSREAFKAKGFEKYIFETQNYKYFDEMRQQGTTDAAGKYSASFDLAAKGYNDMGLLKARLFATVFDESGRPVNRAKTVPIYTQNTFYGINNFSEYVSTHSPLNIPLVALNKEGKPMSAKAHLKIIRNEWRTVLESSGEGRYQYRSQQQSVVEIDKTVQISGSDTKFAYTPQQSGQYEIRLSVSEDAEAYIKKEFYAYSYGNTLSTSFEVNREGQVGVEFDKEKYITGESAKVLFTCPFEGKLLVTLERDRVIKHLYFDTDKKVKQISLDLSPDYVPNIFISATLIRPMRELNVPLTVAHGYGCLLVENPKNKLPVEVVAEANVRSKTQQKIKIKSEPNTQLTLAVVDEGILQIKNYQTPRPYDYFYERRGLEVTSHDIYPYLFPEVVPNALLSGGDGGYDLSKRSNPMTNKRVKLVSYWSGIVQTDSKGFFEHTVNIPQFSGDLRIMAVAYKDQRYGTGASNMKVADPVVLSTGLPRFLSPRDTVDVPVTISNTTKNGATGEVSVKVEGGLAIVGSNSSTVTLGANAESRANFRVAALNDIGEGKIIVRVKSMGETFIEETDLSIRPPSSLQKMNGNGAIEGGKTLALDMPNNFVPESIDGKLILSRSPLTEFLRDLDYLIQYPHGCLEQTVAAAFPQVYYFDLAKSTGHTTRTATMPNSNNPNFNVQEAINKLTTMQLANGGMMYWQGGSGEENWWGSVFAAHFLIEAKKAGFEVREETLGRLTKYLQQKLSKKDTYRYHFRNRDNKEEFRDIARKEIPYSLYVLALAGKSNASAMNYYKSKPVLLSFDGRYLLSAAFALSGDLAKAKQVLPDPLATEDISTPNDESFDSPLRSKALALNALLETDPKNAQIATLTKHVLDDYKKDRYHNTQESSFTLLALGKAAKMSGPSNATATVSVGGKKVADFKGENLVLTYKDFKGSKVDIATSGTGKLYYFWDLEGLTRDGSYVQEDSYLKVRRQFLDRTGKPLASNNVKQNDLIVVKITLASTGSASVGNVVVTDILPAGFEPENSRLTETTDLPWIKDAATPDHQDFRDDRVNFFVTAESKPKSFYYTVRAVSAGKYRVGPVSADAMYAGEYHSYHGAGAMVVL